ncbi:D-threo-aldose 1-dehydrogenase [Lentzea xinjiangensis]|uniref:D-threo-aldose 1-dehydrogenase n=1 Tax=Lentzea xinjiangensis TaxID=402600 RepID=A0A1H9ENU2_9PSEU|nr:aldo/keto reductase [Lentzea xinjiangensis]SEQ27247.1 D-threo-aldose 1-dehydrogenase [Lentzea xinjiangensis]
MKVAVSRLGFGGAPIGNLYREISDAEAFGAVEAAWQTGVRYFDTAPHYGLGLSERRLGVALTGRPRAEYVLSTKVGRLLEPFDGEGLDDEGFAVPRHFRRVRDYSADGVKRSLESSLERLGTDRVEIVYIHDPDDHWDEAFGEAYPALEELRSQGVVGAIGVGMNQWEMPERFVRETDVDVVMLAGRYTVLEQPALPSFLPACAERGVSVVACGVFNSGLLSKPVVPSGAKYDYADAPAALVARARAIAEVCGRHGVTLPQVAIQFALGHPAVVSVVIGSRTAEQMTSNAAHFSAPVPAALWDELKSAGLLGEEVPTP